jgi:hypothetical protein
MEGAYYVGAGDGDLFEIERAFFEGDRQRFGDALCDVFWYS